MKRLFPLLILIIILSSCRKSESDFIWEKTFGNGEAKYVRTSADSGFAACGERESKPYFIRFDRNGSRVIEISGEMTGLFSSAWFDNSGYITGGNTGGKMLLMRHSPDGNKLWEKTPESDFYIDYTQLIYTGNGELLAIGTASPDSAESGADGLLFARFDTTGQIISEVKITEPSFIAAYETLIDNSGNIYLALTRKTAFAKPKASVAKFNGQYQKLWETDLSNNPDFGAASMTIIADGSGNVYVAGKTELPVEGDVLNNSFVASITNSGYLTWKKYPENSNSGTALVFNDAGELMMLNKNCFFVNILDPESGSDAGRMRMFSDCDPYTTNAFGTDFDISYDKNILVAGSHGGSFYIALKSYK